MRVIARILFLVGVVLIFNSAQAQNCPGNPYNLANGTTADATQVMANFNNLLACANATPSLASVRGTIGGLQLSNNNPPTPSQILNISIGTAIDSTNSYIMTLASAFTKSTSTWAVGSGNGALDTGSVTASTWYHVFLIARSDTGVVDVLFSLSPSSPTMPTNYNYRRRIGSILTDTSSNIVLFNQYGDEFWWKTVYASVADQSLPVASTRTPFAVQVPTMIQTEAMITVEITGNPAPTYLTLTNADQTDTIVQTDLAETPSGAYASSRYRIVTNTNSQIYGRVQISGALIWIYTLGWVDTRGRFN